LPELTYIEKESGTGGHQSQMQKLAFACKSDEVRGGKEEFWVQVKRRVTQPKGDHTERPREENHALGKKSSRGGAGGKNPGLKGKQSGRK